MTSTTERSRQATEAQLRQLTTSIDRGLRGPALAEHLIAAACQALRHHELEAQAAIERAPTHRRIISPTWENSRLARAHLTDSVLPDIREIVNQRLLAEEHVDLRSAA